MGLRSLSILRSLYIYMSLCYIHLYMFAFIYMYMYVMFISFINNMKITPEPRKSNIIFFLSKKEFVFAVNSHPKCYCTVFCNRKMTCFSDSGDSHLFIFDLVFCHWCQALARPSPSSFSLLQCWLFHKWQSEAVCSMIADRTKALNELHMPLRATFVAVWSKSSSRSIKKFLP